MLYREVGQFKTNYQADQAIFPIAQDRWCMAVLLVAWWVVRGERRVGCRLQRVLLRAPPCLPCVWP